MKARTWLNCSRIRNEIERGAFAPLARCELLARRVYCHRRRTWHKESRATPVPLSDEMRGLLTRLKRARGKAAPDTFIVQTTSARKCLETACRKLGLPNFHHHSLRHYFARVRLKAAWTFPPWRAGLDTKTRRVADENLRAFAASAQCRANEACEFSRRAGSVTARHVTRQIA